MQELKASGKGWNRQKPAESVVWTTSLPTIQELIQGTRPGFGLEETIAQSDTEAHLRRRVLRQVTPRMNNARSRYNPGAIQPRQKKTNEHFLRSSCRRLDFTPQVTLQALSMCPPDSIRVHSRSAEDPRKCDEYPRSVLTPRELRLRHGSHRKIVAIGFERNERVSYPPQLCEMFASSLHSHLETL